MSAVTRGDAIHLLTGLGAYLFLTALAALLVLLADLLFALDSPLALCGAFIASAFAVAFIISALFQLLAIGVALYGVLTK